MNILISNDDGIESEGIIILAKTLAKEHKVLVVAPDRERSASGHSISIKVPLKLNKIKTYQNFDAFSLCGTPADCVKFGLHYLSPYNIDMVVSGINRGKNIGTDVMYSGTVSAAMEGLISGVKAVAVSYSGCGGYDFNYAAEFVRKNLGYFYSLESRALINVNFPDCGAKDIKGIKVTPLGAQLYNDNYKKTGENGNCSFILDSLPHKTGENPEDCDVSWNSKEYITITPLKTDLTDYAALNNLDKKAIIL